MHSLLNFCTGAIGIGHLSGSISAPKVQEPTDAVRLLADLTVGQQAVS